MPSPAGPSTAPSADRPTVRSLAMPTEHGGWSFTLEPSLLGLIVAPSGAGAALAAAALVAFLAHTPARTALVDRHRGRRLPRTALAERVALVEVALLVVLVVVALLVAEAPFWVPLVVALPLIAVEVSFDARSRSRRLAPELAGTIAMGSVATAIALAGGTDPTVAYGLWLVVAARSLATVPFVRLQLRRGKGQPHAAWHSDVAQALALVVVAVGLAVDAVPVAAVVAIAVLALFQVVAARLPVPKVAVVGAQQVALGLGVVLATALGTLAP